MSLDKNKIKKFIGISCTVLGTTFVGLSIVAKIKKPSSVYDDSLEEKNPLEGKKVIFVRDDDEKENADGVRGHLEVVGNAEYYPTFYDKYVKRGLDIILSFGGIIVLSPVMLIIAICIYMEDPGPVVFTQKRLGQNKKYFKLHKFRTMKLSTPHDVPTHQLVNPEQYILHTGAVIRRHSGDELLQLWDIFIGNMSVIGPRPGLWNQDLLTSERDKYGANDVKPGLTGWAQINGRDELDIPAKAKLDGEYVQNRGLIFDIKCFLGTIKKVGHDDSVVEGGTGMKRENTEFNPKDCDTTPITKKSILITGANSYIGKSVQNYLITVAPNMYEVNIRETKGWEPTPEAFVSYDVVFNVAGIAHIRETDENRQLYYDVNRDLVIKIAEAAKKAGVKQFVMLSSMSVYGKTVGYITKDTKPAPINAYGDAKIQADERIQQLADEKFIVSILRPPMVYGKGCKGNYQTLRKFALKLPVFPDYKNERSMIYIGNLCEFVKRVIDREEGGVFFPQNKEYVRTTDMVKLVALKNGKKIMTTSLFNVGVRLAPFNVVKKVFGNLTYKRVDTVSKFGFEESIEMTECNNVRGKNRFKVEGISTNDLHGKKILFFAPAFFGYEYKMADKMCELGAKVDFYDERSVTSSKDRALLKVSPEIFAKRSYSYYKDIIDANKSKDYDYVFIVKGEMTPVEILKDFRIYYPNAKLCLYLYDSVKNVRGIEKKFQYFDTCHSFDPEDCEKYSALKFRPLFFSDEFRQPVKNGDDYDYDICFMGTVHSDRYKVIKQVQKISNELGLRQNWFLYLQSEFIYYFYKITKREFFGTSISDFDLEKKSGKEIAAEVDKTKIVLDVQHPKQRGLTMRTIEMIGMNKKLITTNKTIKHYDFYNPNNVCVIDRNNVQIDMEFLNTPYQELDDKMYESYSLESWIKTVLN